jgi:bifunctional DNase/RNase
MVNVDCRPSDGIALAVRLGVPILAADELEPILAAA